MYYTNGSAITKTFHGVTFQPGETKEVFGYIQDPAFYRSSKRQEPPKREGRSNSTSENITPKKEAKKEANKDSKNVKEKVKEDTKLDIQINNEINHDSEVDDPNKTS